MWILDPPEIGRGVQAWEAWRESLLAMDRSDESIGIALEEADRTIALIKRIQAEHSEASRP